MRVFLLLLFLFALSTLAHAADECRVDNFDFHQISQQVRRHEHQTHRYYGWFAADGAYFGIWRDRGANLVVTTTTADRMIGVDHVFLGGELIFDGAANYVKVIEINKDGTIGTYFLNSAETTADHQVMMGIGADTAYSCDEAKRDVVTIIAAMP